VDELLEPKQKKPVEPKEKIDEDSAFLSYVKHLFHKKVPSDCDNRLIEILNKVVIIPAYKALDASAKKEFVKLWEDEIVKNDYDYWRIDTSGRCKWFSKITPDLHLRVILDKIES
jgi:cellulose biosynthesis protein BcsQ